MRPSADETEHVPISLRVSAAWAWRLLIVGATVALILVGLSSISIIVVPMLISVVIASILVPFSGWLQRRHRWPKWAAVIVSEVGVLLFISGLLTFAIWQIRVGSPALLDRMQSQIEAFSAWLHGPPLSLTDSNIGELIQQAQSAIELNSDALLTGALGIGSTLGQVLTGILLILFATLFFLIDGGKIFSWVLQLFPRGARSTLNEACQSAWRTLSAFVKVQVIVAAFNSVGIGVGAYVLGLFYGGFPLVIPIAIVVFLGSFIPFLGAILSGALAVFVALVFLGPVPALLMLIIVLVIQQIEGHILQPFIMGSAVQVHPLAVILAVATGGIVAGLPGTFFAVPLVAVANTMINVIAKRGSQSNDAIQHE